MDKKIEQADFSEYTVIFLKGNSKREMFCNVVAQNKEKAEEAFLYALTQSIITEVRMLRDFFTNAGLSLEEEKKVEEELKKYHVYTINKKI